MALRKIRRRKGGPRRVTPGQWRALEEALGRNDLASALTLVEGLLARGVEEPLFLELAGLVMGEGGRRDRALALLRRQEARGLLSPWGHYHLGRLLQMEGREKEAEAAYRRALALEPSIAPAWNNLGLLLLERGEARDAIPLLRRALELDPSLVEAWNNLGVALEETGDPASAETAYTQALELVPRHLSARFNRAHLLQRRERWEEARRELRAVLELDPSHQEARYLLAALEGESPSRAPVPYLRRLFDQVAGRFDAILVEELEYRTPQELFRLLHGLGAVQGRALDAGCGTGLGAHLYRPLVSLLMGCDISPRMLLKARERGVYDHLAAFDLLAPWPLALRFHLIYAADVLVYCGDLALAGRRFREALLPGGFLGFSVELLQEPGGVRLLPTGRYAHSREAVAEALTGEGFQVVAMEERILRKEGGREVEGLLVAAKVIE